MAFQLGEVARKDIKEFLKGKFEVADDLNHDFIHGFASAVIYMYMELGMSLDAIVLAQYNYEEELEHIIAEVRAASN